MYADVDRDGTIVDTIDVLREAHYYPFGMEMKGPWSMTTDSLHPYLYNNKEFNLDSADIDGDGKKELALGWYDYGARFYDPSVGRFTGVDPIADQFPHLSTYNYADNSPIAFIDLWGLQKASPPAFRINIKAGLIAGAYGDETKFFGQRTGYNVNFAKKNLIGFEVNASNNGIDANVNGIWAQDDNKETFGGSFGAVLGVGVQSVIDTESGDITTEKTANLGPVYLKDEKLKTRDGEDSNQYLGISFGKTQSKSYGYEAEISIEVNLKDEVPDGFQPNYNDNEIQQDNTLINKTIVDRLSNSSKKQ